ncbi:glycosyltransferase family protein [Pandoraea communis]|uniref:glycosyltransferase family protein n=1 Tax=Pandoraea communis TaxID=2508297 RepID=UPI0025A62281|nr:glycosyltransferase [Pandoraea communis]MDM8358270.1 glycosyltransferase [Pandoraea communis]
MNNQRARRLPTDRPTVKKGQYVLCVPAGWESYISLEFYEMQQTLVSYGWTKLVIGEFDDVVIMSAIHEAQVVLLWEAYELIERNADALNALPSSIRRMVFCDDVHHFTMHRRQQRLRAFLWADRILATYPDKLLQWYPEVAGTKIEWTPHAAASYFQAAPSTSSDRVLLSGSRTWPYPFRQFCESKLPASVCQVVDHPGYPGYPGDRANTMHADPAALARLGREGYAALLRSHPAMLVCGSVFGYLVAKVFEAMAAECLVIAERASLGERLNALGFVEGEDYAGTDLLHVIEDTIAVREAYVQGDAGWKRIVENAQRKVFVQHTTSIRASQIHRLCIGGSIV